jgi:phage-related protein
VKRVVWIGDSLERVRGFPVEARREAGYQLERVQAGATDIDLARRRFGGLVKERKRL